MREWRQKNKEHLSEYNRKYAADNSEKIAANKKKWRADNPDKVREHDRRYKKKHRKELREKAIEYYNENRDRVLAYQEKYRAENADKIKEWRKDYWDREGKAKRAEVCAKRMKFINRYKLMCGCTMCGYDLDPVALDFHHVDPETKELRQLQNHPIHRIKDEIRKCIVLCANCHRIVHFSKQE
jgi:hypothetical protein